LSQHKQVQSALALLREDQAGEKKLVVYIVAAPGCQGNRSQLHNYLKQHLPPYMLPSAWVWLERLPLNANGKVDLRALPPPEFSSPEEERSALPGNKVELAIATIWKEILHMETIGSYDNFFDIGGHSLLLLQIRRRLQQSFSRDIPLIELFKHTNISSLAKYLSQNEQQVMPLRIHRQRSEERIVSQRRQRQRIQDQRSKR
jgi:acyl carrier protein